MVVAIGLSENIDGLIIVLYCLLELPEAFFRVCQKSEAFSHLNALPFSLGVLLDDQSSL